MKKQNSAEEAVLIANRGEIAIRIAKTCKMMGLRKIAIFSEADRFAEHTRICDEAYCVGGALPSESYLNIPEIVRVARESGARYIHPGYGFLSERPEFVEACEKAGLVFLGPTGDTMRRMGDKIRARETVDELGVPRVPGSAGALASADEAEKVATEIGFPVLLKAAAGGGGKGMRRVDSADQVRSAFEGAQREALNAFGDGAVYIEKLILEPHHVEVQVFGDGKGNAICLGERECSIQRRHQKIWEESPSPHMRRFPEQLEKMFASAKTITESLNYRGAGTIEFIVDSQGGYYFLEMNTRLQVEHPVTEWVTGEDLVSWQIRLGQGQFEFPKEISIQGWAIEVRVYAEDPSRFLPAPGQMGAIRAPSGPFVRWDSAFQEPGVVSIHYDPMISKLSVWGASRDEAIGRMRAALDDVRIEPLKDRDGVVVDGFKTNLRLLRRLVRHSDVIEGDTPTHLIQENPELIDQSGDEISPRAAVAVSLFQMLNESERAVQNEEASTGRAVSLWKQHGLQEGLNR